MTDDGAPPLQGKRGEGPNGNLSNTLAEYCSCLTIALPRTVEIEMQRLNLDSLSSTNERRIRVALDQLLTTSSVDVKHLAVLATCESCYTEKSMSVALAEYLSVYCTTIGVYSQ